MSRSKSASLHSGLLIRKGEASPTPPLSLDAHKNTAEEVQRNFRDGDVASNSELSPTLDRMVNANYDDIGDTSERSSDQSLPAEEEPSIDADDYESHPLVEMEPQAEIRTVADILALGRTHGTLPIPKAAIGHANGGAIVTLHLTAAQMERLDTIADMDSVPAAQLVMDAVTNYIRKVVTDN